MITSGISRLIILFFGILYPAYSSYKAIRTKNVKEYVRWMMHWIVMAAFQLIETFSDVFLCWFPFYYEAKVCIVFWLLSPMTKGSSILYKKFIHPKLSRHEQEIDDYINQAKTKGYSTVIQFGTKSFDYASKLIVETAIKATGSMIINPQQLTLPSSQHSIISNKNNKINNKHTYDVVDHAHDMEELIPLRNATPISFVIDDVNDDNEIIDEQQQQQFYAMMLETNNSEFSDFEEPRMTRARTRSQSRAKENTPPTVEPKTTVLKRSKKTAKTERVRRRKPLKEEVISDDDIIE